MRIVGIGILFLIACCARAQAASISGAVIDDTGRPIKGATAKLFPSGNVSQMLRSVETDAIEGYRFENLPPGTYDLDFSRPYFAPALVRGIRLTAHESKMIHALKYSLEESSYVTACTEKQPAVPETLHPLPASTESARIAGRLKLEPRLKKGFKIASACPKCRTTVAGDGSYVLSGVPPGEQLLTISLDGYYPTTFWISIQGGFENRMPTRRVAMEKCRDAGCSLPRIQEVQILNSCDMLLL